MSWAKKRGERGIGKESGNRVSGGCSRRRHLWADLLRLDATHLCATAWEIRPRAQWPCGHRRCQNRCTAQPIKLLDKHRPLGANQPAAQTSEDQKATVSTRCKEQQNFDDETFIYLHTNKKTPPRCWSQDSPIAGLQFDFLQPLF